MRRWIGWILSGSLGLSAIGLSPGTVSAGCLTNTQVFNNTASTKVPRIPTAQPRPYQPIADTGTFSVFGAKTLSAGQFGVGAGYLGEEAVCQQKDGFFDLNTVWGAVAFGITDRLQVGVDFPYGWYEADRLDRNFKGLDDINVGVKYRFLDESGGSPSIGALGFATFPSAEKDKLLGTGKTDAGVKLIISKVIFEKLIAHVNVGYTYVGKESPYRLNDEFTSGIGLELPVTSKFSAMAELLANTYREKDNHSGWQSEGRVGFRYQFTASLMVSAAGRAGFTNDSPDWGLFTLLSFVWPPAPGKAIAGPVPPPAAAPPAPPAAVAPAPGVPGPPVPPAAPAPGVPARPGEPTIIPPTAAVPGAVPGAPIPGVFRVVFRDIHFAFDRYDLTNEAKAQLQEAVNALKANPGVQLIIEGHADERGTVEYNLALGEKRAEATREYLINLGVTRERLSSISYGEERPLDPGHDERAWALNRRAHFVLTVK